MQFEWLEELRRITQPGGYLILTTSGEKHYSMSLRRPGGHARERFTSRLDASGCSRSTDASHAHRAERASTSGRRHASDRVHYQNTACPPASDSSTSGGRWAASTLGEIGERHAGATSRSRSTHQHHDPALRRSGARMRPDRQLYSAPIFELTASTPSRGVCVFQLDAPLLLEVGLVLLPERVVARPARACGTRPGRRGGRTRPRRRRRGSRLLPHADGEVVVLEHADAVGLVQRPDLARATRAGAGDAVHRGHADVEDSARGAPRARRAAKAGEPRDRRRNPARPAPRCRRSWSSDTGGRSTRSRSRWRDEPAHQARRHDGVVVEQDDDLAPRRRDALVVGGREAPVLRRSGSQRTRGSGAASVAQVLRRAVGRGVVDDEDLEPRPGLAGRSDSRQARVSSRPP